MAAWSVARQLARAGRRAEALAQANRLLAQAEVPPAIAADAHRLAAELCLDGLRFAAARRHLRSALRHEPANAALHYLVGRSFEEDPNGCDGRASRWFGKAMTLAPTTAKFAAAFGRAAVRSDRVELGLKGLRKAATLAPGDLAVVRVVVEGLIDAGKAEEARRAINRARFLCPGRAELDRLEHAARFEAGRQRQNQQSKQDAHARHGWRLDYAALRPPGEG